VYIDGALPFLAAPITFHPAEEKAIF